MPTGAGLAWKSVISPLGCGLVNLLEGNVLQWIVLTFLWGASHTRSMCFMLEARAAVVVVVCPASRHVIRAQTAPERSPE